VLRELYSWYEVHNKQLPALLPMMLSSWRNPLQRRVEAIEEDGGEVKSVTSPAGMVNALFLWLDENGPSVQQQLDAFPLTDELREAAASLRVDRFKNALRDTVQELAFRLEICTKVSLTAPSATKLIFFKFGSLLPPFLRQAAIDAGVPLLQAQAVHMRTKSLKDVYNDVVAVLMQIQADSPDEIRSLLTYELPRTHSGRRDAPPTQAAPLSQSPSSTLASRGDSHNTGTHAVCFKCGQKGHHRNECPTPCTSKRCASFNCKEHGERNKASASKTRAKAKP
jgi:hypothetical protein